MSFLAAVVQLTTSEDPTASINAAKQLVAEAAQANAQLVALPEAVNFLGSQSEKKKLAEPISGPTFRQFSEWAKQYKITLLAGSIAETSDDPDRPYNTSVMYGPNGECLAIYRKMHLFDLDLGPDTRLFESNATKPGEDIVAAYTELGCIGMSICYDLRFPELFRYLTLSGAEILAIPSAFTPKTGQDHWLTLLRARAIENQCYVIAPAQIGQNSAKRQTYGRSMIIDPWGVVLATCPDYPSFALAHIDLEQLRTLRQKMPCLNHQKIFNLRQNYQKPV